MEITFRWIGFGAGLLLAGFALVAAAAIGFDLKRPLLARAGIKPAAALFAAMGRRIRSDRRRARLLTGRGPVAAVVAILGIWGALVLGIGLTMLPWDDPTPAEALRNGAAAVLGVGLLGTGAVPTVLALIGAAAGVLVAILTVLFLVRLGGVVGRGQRVVASVEARCGVPPWGAALVAGYAEAGAADRLAYLYRETERWAAELAPRGDPLPLWFRSAGTMVDGATALVAVMDAAALDIALRPDEDHPDARMLLLTGTDALRSTRDALGIVPAPVRTAMLTEEGFALGFERIRSAGFGADGEGHDAWGRFVGLRRTYAPAAVAVARRLLSPPAPWMGEWPGPRSSGAGQADDG